MQFNERSVETLIDNDLKNIGWNDKRGCNVYKQSVKTEEQKNALKGKRPDYVLYKDNSNIPLAIIEAKKPHSDIQKAQQQGIEYAKKIKSPIVYATDGIFTKTYHVEKQKPLYLNGEEVDELLRQSILVNDLQDNVYCTQNKKVIQSRQSLITVFKDINNLFRDGGIRAGLDRINLLSNMLFLKIISELHDMNINETLMNFPPECYLWNNFKNKKGLELIDFLNKQAFDHFKKNYGGEVISKIENIICGRETILNDVIEKLDDLWLSDTNSDIKGDAFEFFLRNYGGAETDFGEYFTPRHIVKTLVKLLNPQYGETVYDPFCGSGGMLIESFKHIKRKMPQKQETIKKLKEKTVYGSEITTMDRIAKMNMILTGDGHSNITRQDSYEHSQSNKHDVVITNIPFGVKLKTNFLGNYGFSGTSAELAGVLHCLDALNKESENARAGIIVPEGILFNKTKQYTALREKLVEQHELETVISLPQGIFVDTAVKSNILIIKKRKNANKKHIWHFTVKSDGYSLDKGRRPIETNDLKIVLQEHSISKNKGDEQLAQLEKVGFRLLLKEKLRSNKYILLSNQYAIQNIVKYNKYPMVELEHILEYEQPEKYIVTSKNYNNDSKTPVLTAGKSFILGHTNEMHGIFPNESLPVIIFCDFTTAIKFVDFPFKLRSSAIKILKAKGKNNIRFIFYMMQKIKFTHVQHKRYWISEYSKLKIPLPSIEVQNRIVDEIDAEEKVIDGLKQAINNYTPQITIQHSWEMVELDKILDLNFGERITKKANTGDLYSVYGGGGESFKADKYNREDEFVISRFGMSKNCVRYVKGKFWLMDSGGTVNIKNNFYTRINKKFIGHLLLSMQEKIYELGRGQAQKNLDTERIKTLKIPLPSIEVQNRIVDEIDAEEENIKACKDLIKQIEKRKKEKINDVWKN